MLFEAKAEGCLCLVLGLLGWRFEKETSFIVGCWLFSDAGLTVTHEGTIGVFGSLGCCVVSWPTKHGAHSAQLLHLQKEATEVQRGRVSFPVSSS